MTAQLNLVAPTYSVLSFKGAELPEQYNALIFSKWLRSLRFGNPTFKNIDSDQYYKNYHKFLENLLKKPDAIVRLAVLSEDHDIVLGFSASREDVLDYVHVQKDYRRHGIARKLFPSDMTAFSHLTLTWLKIWRFNDRYKHWKFNPFA